MFDLQLDILDDNKPTPDVKSNFILQNRFI